MVARPDDVYPTGARGVVRRIDDLGRVVIPVEYRKVLGIKVGDHLDLTLEGDGLALRPLRQACSLCGGVADLQPFRTSLVCGDCRDALGSSHRERGAHHPPSGRY